MFVVPTATPSAFMPVSERAPATVTDQVSGPASGRRCTATTNSKSVGFKSQVCPTTICADFDSEAGTSNEVQPSSVLLDGKSSRGFAFNCLTSYSDADKMRDDLYYADPCKLFDRCKRRYSRRVALLHDYGLWEFTILVRKTP